MNPSKHRPRVAPRPLRVLLLVAVGSIALAAVGAAPAPVRAQALDALGPGPIERLPLRKEGGDYIDPYSAAFAPAVDNGYYGLWFELGFNEPSPGHLMGQRFDGADQAIGTPRQISTTTSGPIQYRLQLRQAGDLMLAVWRRNTSTSPNIFGRFLNTHGAPQTPVFPIGETSSPWPAVVLFDSGNALVVWHDTGTVSGRLVARTIGPNGALGPLVFLASGDKRYPALGVDGEDRVLVVWQDFQRAKFPYQDLLALWLDADGHPTSSPFLVAHDTTTAPSVSVWPDGRSAVVWATCSEQSPRGDCEVRFRSFDSDGSPLGPVVRFSPDDGRSHVEPVTAIGADGVMFVSWQACPAVPGGNFGVCRFHAVAIDEDGDLLATAPVLDVGGEQERRKVVALENDFLVTWYGYNAHPDGIYAQRYRYTAAPSGGEPPVEGDPPPPAGVTPLSSAEIPGFRFWVQIGEDTEAVDGTMEPVCIPETVCVSGSLAGRSEVFLRVVGPKPNGYLWPTLVKFSTSRVQVWIEQISTGTVRYYDLAGATPGSSDLPGLFDREGFQP